MKKIKLANITKADKSNHYTRLKKHSVSLGNDLTVYFSDYKDASKFLVDTNRFLNEKLFEVNQIYMDLFCEYRRIWFNLSGDESINQAVILNYFQMIEKTFNLMVTRSHFINGNHFVFKYYFDVIEALGMICKTIVAVYRAKKQYSQAYQLNVITGRLEILKVQLKSWSLKS